MIERNDERSGFQLRTEIMRSRCAGPLQPAHTVGDPFGRLGRHDDLSPTLE